MMLSTADYWMNECLVAQSCLTLCDSMNCSLSGSSVHGILQARILEWVAIPSSTQGLNPGLLGCIACKVFTNWATREAQLLKTKSLSHVRLFATPWTATCQAPQSMWFSRQEYWSGLPFPSPGDLPNPGIELRSPAMPADTLLSEPPGKPIIRQIQIQS